MQSLTEIFLFISNYSQSCICNFQEYQQSRFGILRVNMNHFILSIKFRELE